MKQTKPIYSNGEIVTCIIGGYKNELLEVESNFWNGFTNMVIFKNNIMSCGEEYLRKYNATVDLSLISTDALKAELNKRGISTEFSVADVERNLAEYNEDLQSHEQTIELTFEQQLDVLNSVLSGERIGREVNEAMYSYIEDEYAERII